MRWFSKLFNPTPKTPRLTVDTEGLYQYLRQQLHRDCEIRLGDRDYVSLSENEAFVCVRNIQTFYRPGVNDCDDFANLAKSEAIKKQRSGAYGGGVAAFGQVWLETHALNFFLDHKGNIRLIDNDGTEIVVSRLKQEATLILA